jgi:hypothetical protein
MSYGQTYIVKTTGSDLRTETSRQAFSQIGSSCYSGDITLSLRHAFCDVTLKDIPSLIHEVQQQQSGLQYLCEASKIPVSSSFYLALNEFEWARNFVVTEATSPSISNQIAKLRDKLPWLDNDESRVYFELVGDTANKFADILFIASKAYTQGMCFISLYFEGVIYVTLEDITSDTQPLLGISFPDISGSSGDGATLALYENEGPWMKLSVWEVQSSPEQGSQLLGAEVNRLEKKLEEVGSCCEPDSDEEAAWDVDGKPRAGPHHFDCEESSSGSCKDDAIAEKDSPDIVDEEGDIYAQLDRLDLMLNNELEGLAPLLNNDAPT